MLLYHNIPIIMMEPIMFLVVWLALLFLLHLWGRSTFVGAWTGVLVLLTAVWLASNPYIIKVGETTTYSYAVDATLPGGLQTKDLNTTVTVDVYGPLPNFPGTNYTWSQLMALMLAPIGIYMIFWNALHPRK